MVRKKILENSYHSNRHIFNYTLKQKDSLEESPAPFDSILFSFSRKHNENKKNN
jgi:hypothetical protein